MRVLVLDLTHGGDILARKYLSRGCAVTAVDIYRNSSALYAGLEKDGVRCLQTSPAENFDLAVVPVHAPDSFLGPSTATRVITHHQAVGELAKFAFPTVEMTGVRGKTSTAQVLSFLLAREGLKVLSLTSSGLMSCDAKSTVLEEKVSIAPATLLRLADGFLDFDLGVLEVSLGGSGLAEVGVITGLQEDYEIARRTRRAFDGKSQMVRGSQHHVVFPENEMDLWNPLVPEGVKVLTFGPGGDVDAVVRTEGLGEKAILELVTRRGRKELFLSGNFLSPAYAPAFACALATVTALGMDALRVAEHLTDFPGAAGRGEVTVDGTGALVRERNPGVSASSLGFQLDMLVNHYGCRDIGLVLDPVNMKVCEKLELDRVGEVCDRFPEVKGRYILPSGQCMETNGFLPIAEVGEARERHATVLWATKEGYL